MSDVGANRARGRAVSTHFSLKRYRALYCTGVVKTTSLVRKQRRYNDKEETVGIMRTDGTIVKAGG